jgi:hypothetical protein
MSCSGTNLNNPETYDRNNGDYSPPSPPWSVTPYTNPTWGAGGYQGQVATGGSATDPQGNSGFRTPYSDSGFSSTQQYQWQCSCYNSGTWNNFLGQALTITRTIAQTPGGQWLYQVCKPNIPPAL